MICVRICGKKTQLFLYMDYFMRYLVLITLSCVTLLGCGSSKTQVVSYGLDGQGIPVEQLYTQNRADKSFTEVLASDALKPHGTFTTKGVLGAKVSVNTQLIETGPYGQNPINSAKRDMRIHTIAHPAIHYDDFYKWTRWYQEQGNTQIFRLFKDEVNVSNKRANAARVEAFIPSQKWLPEPGVWREFGARFTIVKSAGCIGFHHCSIFQAKGNNVDHWSVMLRVDDKGALWYHPRRGMAEENNRDRQLIAEQVLGKPFDLKVLDNGLDYQMFIDGRLVGTDRWPRTKEIGFRWGIYVGESEVVDDVVVLVTGASMR